MRKRRSNVFTSFSPVRLVAGVLAVTFVGYVGLISIVMGYATTTVEFSQSVKQDKAAVAKLESEYLVAVNRIAATDYRAVGYAKPVAQTYVHTESVTALR